MNAVGPISQLSLPAVQTAAPQAAPAPTTRIDVPVQAPAQTQKAEVRTVEQQRYQAVERAARQIANPYVVSTQAFTIFKDATGQYITRLRDLRTGNVKYVPEPQLLKLNGSSEPALKIQA